MKKKYSFLTECFYCYCLIALCENTVVLIFWTRILKAANKWLILKKSVTSRCYVQVFDAVVIGIVVRYGWFCTNMEELVCVTLARFPLISGFINRVATWLMFYHYHVYGPFREKKMDYSFFTLFTLALPLLLYAVLTKTQGANRISFLE